MIQEDKLKELSKYALDNIRYIIEEFGDRSSGSQAEYQAHKHMAKDLENFADEVKLEEFKVAPKAFLGFFQIIGVLILSSIALYWVIPWLALILDLIVLFLIVQEFFRYKLVLDKFYPKKTSTNLIGIKSPLGAIKQRILFGGHPDAAFEMRYNKSKNRNLVRMILIPAILLLIFKLFADIALTIFNFSWQSGYSLTNIWVIFGIIGLCSIPMIIAIMRFIDFSVVVPGAGDNLSGSYVMLAVAKYLHEHQIKMKNTEIIFLNTGSEEAGLRGAKAYVKKHIKELKELPSLYIAVDTFRDRDFLSVMEKDLNGTLKHDPRAINLILKAGENIGIPLQKQIVYIGSTDATAFTQAGIPATAFGAMDPGPAREYHTRYDKWENLGIESIEDGIKIMLEVLKIYDEHGI